MAIRWRVQTTFLGFLPIAMAAIAAACGLFVLAMTLRMVVLGWSPAPLWDQWDNLVTGHPLSWSWLVKQHNEHRLFVPRLIFWLDRWLAAETNIVNFAVNILAQATLAALLVWLALKDAAADRSTKIWAVGLCLTLLFWAIQYENFVWGFQVQFFGVVLFAAATFAIVATGPATGPGAAAAALFSGAAVYTLASGILVPPLALLLGLWVGRPRWYLVVLLIAAVAWPAFYLWGYETPGIHSNPAAVGFYFLVDLGGPFSGIESGTRGGQEDFELAAIVGAAGVVLYLLALILLARDASETYAKRALAMLGLYLLGAALLVAAGRVRFGPAQALSSRYATPVIAFWLTTFLLWAALSRRYLRLAIVGGTTALALLATISEPDFVAQGLNFALGRKLATPAVLAGVPDSRLNYLFPRPDFVLEQRPLLLSAHTSVFAEEWTRLMGANFAQFFTVDEKALCSGSFNSADAVDEASSSWSGNGTAWVKGGEALRRIVLVNNEGRIAGYGLGGFEPSSVGEQPEREALRRPVWWTGDFIGTDPSRISAYAVYGAGGACSVGSLIVAAQLPDPAPERGGYVDAVSTADNVITMIGWGFLSGGQNRVMIDTDLPVRSMTLVHKPRPDVAKALNDASLANAGVEVRLFLRSPTTISEPHRLCVWTDDPAYGRRLLHDPSQAGQILFACGAASPANTVQATAPPTSNESK